MGCHRPADHPPAAGIEDEGQVDEALSGADVGYVRYPQPVGLLCGEVPPDQVRGGLLKRYSVWVVLILLPRRQPRSFARRMSLATRFLPQRMPMALSSACALGAP